MSPRSRSTGHASRGDALIVYGDPIFARAFLIPRVEGALSVTYTRDLATARAELPVLDVLRLVLIDLDLDELGPDLARNDTPSLLPPVLAFAGEVRVHAPRALVATLTRQGSAMHIDGAHLLGINYLHRERCIANLDQLAHQAREATGAPDHARRHRFLTNVASSQLTWRQLDVAHCLLRGLTREEVAEFLGIAEATVKSHIRRILRRCDVDNTAELLRAYLRWTSRRSEPTERERDQPWGRKPDASARS